MTIDAGRIRWVFFDVGDTLLDEREAMFDWCGQVAAELTRRRQGTVAVEAADVWLARERAYAEFAPDVLRRILEVLSFSIADADNVYRAARYPHALERPFADATAVLRQLATRFELGVIANQEGGVRDRLRGHGWASLFAVCVSSAEEGVKKPDPAIFRLALARAGCRADEAVMVGDRIDNDIAPARSIGMSTVRVRQGLARKQEPRRRAETPDVTIRRLRELPRVLGLP
jgi:8-oxo-dGTP diphosphatase/putative hydrolase of the HAD superfamily